MDMEKFTERSRGFMQAAQTVAIREGNQRVVPEHLLKALMDDDQGFATNLITKSGGDARVVRQSADAAVAKLPKVSGGDGQVYVDPSLVRVLDEAQKLAQKAGDSFVPAERLLTALAVVNTNARDSLQAGGVSAQSLNSAINDIRKGRTPHPIYSDETRTVPCQCGRRMTGGYEGDVHGYGKIHRTVARVHAGCADHCDPRTEPAGCAGTPVEGPDG